MADRKDPPDRLEREIEEILGKIEQFPGPESRRARQRRRAVRGFGERFADAQRALMRELSRVSMGQVMLLSFLMILGSFFFRRFSPLLMTWVLYGGIILFVTAFAIMLFSRGGSSGGHLEQRWRGRTVRYGQHRPSLSQRLRRWWASRQPRR